MAGDVMIGIIYNIRNKENGKRYVGSTMNFVERRRQHFTDLRGNYHNNPHLQNSYNLYGEESFEFIVLEELDVDRDKLLEREQEWLDCFNWEYNLNPIAIIPPNMAGRRRPEETRQKIRETLTGKKHTTKRRINISRSHAQLKYGEIILIRRMIAGGFSQRLIAECFGVTQASISRINTKQSYIWVADE